MGTAERIDILCIGGPLDGKRVFAGRPLRHDEVVRIPVRALRTLTHIPPASDPLYTQPVQLPQYARYRVWEWEDHRGSLILLADPDMVPRDILLALIAGYQGK